MKKYLSILTLLIVSFSCQDDQSVKSPQQNKDENFVDLDFASDVATVQAPLNNSSTGKGVKKKVESTFEVSPNGKATMYIINYEDGGFIIVAADKRVEPILAYSDKSSFPLEDKVLPTGLLTWLQGVSNTVEDIRKTNAEQNEIVKTLWSKSKEELLAIPTTGRNSSGRTQYTYYVGDCNNGDSGYQQITVVNPLVQTKWDQEGGYNDNCPNLGCSRPSNGRAFTGCVATSMAQILYYHKYPNTFNWNSMALTAPTAETARLMADIGQRIGMDYGCESDNGSGADPDDVDNVLSEYGYSSSDNISYDYWGLRNNLMSNLPVLLGGYQHTYWWIFGHKDGHLWVADGLNETMFYTCAPDPNTPGEWISQYTGYSSALHMNWGWGGDHDGWFGAYNFNPGDRTYNIGQHMIYNIHH
jgi:hypothetical protein